MHAQFNEDTSPTRRRRRLAIPAAAVLALTLGLAACGDSDDEDAAPSATTQASSETTAAETEDVGAFCDAVIEADATFAAGGPEGPDPAQLQAAFDEAASTAPADISDDVDRLITLTQEAFSSGDQEGGPPPEVEELDARIDEYLLANCDFAEVDVTGTEYAFEDIPETVEAGQTAFNFSNDGGEEHEFILVRINDDVTESIEELAQLPEEEAFQKIQPMGFAMAAPGESDLAFVDLEPGRYGALCFFPVGSTPEAVATAEEIGHDIEAPPHFTQGMLAEFTVE
ncbi:hypothetical protein BH23ACT1_BH23ACT1_13450 [soil metagenome]